MFWMLFALGTLLLVISVLGSQVPWKDLTFEKVASLTAGGFLAGSLVLGRSHYRLGQSRVGSIMTVVLSVEFILCLYTLLSLFTYRGR
jgi:hypothetical protein